MKIAPHCRSARVLSQTFPIEPLEQRTLLSAAGTSTALVQSISSSVYGQGVTLTATVSSKSGKPTGSIRFIDGSTTLGTETVNSADKATLTLASLPVGSDSLSAKYLGSSTFAGSSSAVLKHTVAQDLTKTSLTESTSSIIIGQTIAVTVTVTDVAPGAGTPSGQVTLYDGKTALGTQSLNSKGQFSGNIPTLFVGSHALTAVYGGGADTKSSTSSAVTLAVKYPTLSKAADGLEQATLVAGSGPGAVAGDSLHVNYTGYLQNGTVFDSSLNAGRSPFDFTLGEGQVITGWDQGLVGIKVGEQRVLVIPPALAYGATAQAGIPANSTLTFLVNLLSFNVAKLEVFGGAKDVPINNAETPTTTNGTNFGTVTVGKSSTTLTITLVSAGAVPVNFTSYPFVQISGTDAGDFVLTQPVGIASNASTITVTFKPTAKGTRTAIIKVPTTDPTYPNFYFEVQGIGG